MNIAIAQIVKLIVEFIKNLFYNMKLKDLNKEYKELKEKSDESAKDAHKEFHDFMAEYESWLEHNMPSSGETRVLGDVDKLSKEVRRASEDARTGIERLREDSGSAGQDIKRAASAVRRRKGRGKKR